MWNILEITVFFLPCFTDFFQQIPNICEPFERQRKVNALFFPIGQNHKYPSKRSQANMHKLEKTIQDGESNASGVDNIFIIISIWLAYGVYCVI